MSQIGSSEEQQYEKLLALKKVLHQVVQEIDEEIDELEEKLLKLLSDSKYMNTSAPLTKILLELSVVSFLFFTFF